MQYRKAFNEKVDRLVSKHQEAAPKRHENLLLRKKMIEKAYSEQMRIEKKQIASRMNHLNPGSRKVFLAMRLQKIKQHLGE